MKPIRETMTPEFAVTLAFLTLASLALIFIGSLVAPPKLLFGRSLTAIAPALFPTLILSAMAALCAALLALRLRRDERDSDEGQVFRGWERGAVLFGLMTLYALTMEPFGFLISSVLAIVSISVLMGNKSAVQIAIISTVGPVALYLAATRLLAVSLPELNAIEFAYARIIGF